jgi:hypothetical protein
VSISSSVFNGTKVMQGTDFLGYGLQVVTPNAISLETVTANDNFLWGANLQGGGNIAVSNSIFNANTTASPGFIDDTGLFVTGGANVALINVQANDNRLYGAQITAVGTVVVTDSVFNNNRGVTTTGDHGHGLQVNSQGGIFFTGVTVDNNLLFGAELTSDGEIVLTNVNATNNGIDGVLVQGVCVSVNGGNYSGNGQYGLNLGTSALDLGVAPTFGNNAAGDIFPTNPPLCDLLLNNPGNPGTVGGNTTTGASSSNVFASFQIQPSAVSAAKSDTVYSAGTANLTLSEFLSKAVQGGDLVNIFIGKYAFIYTSTGMQILALAPSSKDIAMAGPYRAY